MSYIFDILQVTGKTLFYIGFSAFAGAVYAPFLIGSGTNKKDVQQILVVAEKVILIGLLGVLLWFFAKTGAMAAMGLAGMIDPLMLNIMWSTAVGDAALMRVLGLLGALVLSMTYRHTTVTTQYWLIPAGVTLIMLLAASIVRIGHISDLPFGYQAVLVAHVIGVAWWLGSVPVLWRLATRNDNGHVKQIMQRFAKHAAMPVCVIVLSGATMAYTLFNSFDAVYQTRYGQLLLLKLALVACILLIAAHHKWFLVPELKASLSRTRLSRSIGFEMLFMTVVFIITAALTTVLSP